MILGHDRQIKYLEHVLKNGRFAHAYLFYGPEGVGKFTLAKAVAKFFYCQNYQGLGKTDGCDQCRLIEENLHPGAIVLDPENTLVSKKVPRSDHLRIGMAAAEGGLAKTRKEIPIGDIRELKRKLSFASAGNEWRVVIINKADKMSPEAEAAFLKLLEEPGSRILFILISDSKDILSQTVVSRTQVINFSLVPEKVLSSFLREKTKDSRLVNEILEFAGGRAGKAFELLEDKDKLKKERDFFEEMGALCGKADLAGAFHLSEKATAEDELRRKIPTYLILAARKRLLENGVAFPREAGLRSIKKMQRIWQIMETTNVNPRLALDAMFIEAFNSYGF